MSRVFRALPVTFSLGFTLACSAGDLNVDHPAWDVTLTPSDGGCAPGPWFGNRFWSEHERGNELAEELPEEFLEDVWRVSPRFATAGTEDDFIDCKLDGDDFVCDPAGEDVDGGRLHMQLRGTREAEERITGVVDVVGTTGVAPLAPGERFIVCADTWTFEATRILDPHVRSAKVDEATCADDGLVASAAGGEPAQLFVMNNSSTRVEVVWVDPAGAETRIGTAEPGGGSEFSTTIGAWFRLHDLEDATRCLTLAEVTDVETLVVVHGRQD